MLTLSRKRPGDHTGNHGGAFIYLLRLIEEHMGAEIFKCEAVINVSFYVDNGAKVFNTFILFTCSPMKYCCNKRRG